MFFVLTSLLPRPYVHPKAIFLVFYRRLGYNTVVKRVLASGVKGRNLELGFCCGGKVNEGFL